MIDKNYKIQGDVQLRKFDALPSGAKRVENPQKALAFGEVSGSRHVADGEVEFYEAEGLTWMHVISPLSLKHIGGDHEPVPLEPGVYQYGITLEYDYAKEESRSVAD